MKGLRILNNGQWTKPPMLMAVRRILVRGLCENYQQCSLGDAATFLNGTSYDVSQINQFDGAPIIRISNISDPSSAYLKTRESLDQKFWVNRDDLLVSWSASFKSIIWPGPEGYLNQHIFKVTERPGFSRRFIRHAIEDSLDAMQDNVVGIGMMHIRRSDFLGHPIPAPPIETQEAVADYLDFIESGGNNRRPEIPSALAGYRQIVAKIEEIIAKIEEARRLRNEAIEEAEAIVTSFHMQAAGCRTRGIGTLLALDEDPTPIEATGNYPQVGVRSFGAGLFTKGAVAGTNTTYRTFNRLYSGAIVLSQVKGWEGAIAVCPPELEGWFVSPEYRTFRCVASESKPGYLAALITTKWFWGRLGGATRGVGARRERTRPEEFLRIEVPMPNVSEQHHGEQIFDRLILLKHLQSETAAELDALLPAIIDRAFKGEL